MAYTYINLMEEVLAETGKAMTIKQMWDYACEKEYEKKLASIGKTPNKTMYSCLFKDLAKKEKSKFEKVTEKPSLFSLKNKPNQED